MSRPEVAPKGARFFKMTGSGNDFVFVDGVVANAAWAHEADLIRRLCNRRSGIGGDGIIVIEREPGVAFRMIYYNSDGSRAAFCGNAALCVTRYATTSGISEASEFVFESDAGPIRGRIAADGQPEVDLPPVHSVRGDVPVPLAAGQSRAGFAIAGVPHLVILCADADAVDLPAGAPPLRHHPATNGGANVNYISPVRPSPGIAADAERGEDAPRGPAPGAPEYRMRTYERGVEGETLACGSGAVASAVVAATWTGVGDYVPETVIRTSSGLPLIVRVSRPDDAGAVHASLRGEGRLVFEGVLRDY